jgi:outer membrane immunogenic protein
VTQSISTNYEATLRARIGYATSNWLFYGTGGASFTTMTFRQTFSDTFATASETGSTQKSAIGWTLGGGVEYALPGRWTIRGEYQHMDFGRMSGNGGTLTAFTPAIAFPTNVFTNSANLKVDVVRVGFTYRF